jgi:hypothetical protein
MLTVRQEHSPLIEINVGSRIRAVTMTFTENDEYLVGAGDELGVWRVDAGTQQLETNGSKYLRRVSTSTVSLCQRMADDR